MSDCKRLLRSLKTNERLWLNRSGRTRQMSNRKWIAQVAHDKWATVSDSLRSLMINKQMSAFLKNFWLTNLKSYLLVCFTVHIYIFLSKKWANCSFPLFWWAMWANYSGCSPKMSNVSESLGSLTKNEQCEQIGIAQVPHQNWVNEWISHLLIFSQKTSDSLRKLMSEFLALMYSYSS